MKELFDLIHHWYKIPVKMRQKADLRHVYRDAFKHVFLNKTAVGRLVRRLTAILRDARYHVRSHWGPVAEVESDYDGWSANHYVCFGFVRCYVGHSSYYNGIDSGYTQDDMMLCSDRRKRIESFWTCCWNRDNWSRIDWSTHTDLTWRKK